MAKKIEINGEVLKHDEREVYESTSMGNKVKAVNKDRRTLTIIGSDETQDRDGDVIKVKGWNVDNYKKNPVFLWAHNYQSVPIGAATRVVKQRNPWRLSFTIRFPSEGVHPFADMILNLFDEKIVNASSVGFIPDEWEEVEVEREELEPGKGKRRLFMPRKYLKQELLELSAVPVPSNPSAVQDSIKSIGVDESTKELMANAIYNGTIFELPEDQIKIVEEELAEIEAEYDEEDGVKIYQVPKEFEGIRNEILKSNEGVVIVINDLKQELKDGLDFLTKKIDELEEKIDFIEGGDEEPEELKDDGELAPAPVAKWADNDPNVFDSILSKNELKAVTEACKAVKTTIDIMSK
jgi:hypothetical protein